MHHMSFDFQYHVLFNYMNIVLVFSHFLLDDHLCCFSLFHCISNSDTPPLPRGRFVAKLIKFMFQCPFLVRPLPGSQFIFTETLHPTSFQTASLIIYNAVMPGTYGVSRTPTPVLPSSIHSCCSVLDLSISRVTHPLHKK